MTPTAVLGVLVALALVHMLGEVLFGGQAYACPVCGARSEDSHNQECPWGSH